MEENYNHKEVEQKIRTLWDKEDYFTPKINPQKKPFSIFLTPPNASGGMHIGNALNIAIQDILARHNRIKGVPTLWIPSTDHGGYETQVTFERKNLENSKDKTTHTKKELFKEMEEFVAQNNDLIKKQIKDLGASVDWTRFRFTMDKESVTSIENTFKKMVADELIYRRPYMVYYCPTCKTILSDIELKEKEEKNSLYFIKFPFQDENNFLSLSTTHPEFIFSSTHLLIHKNDTRYSHLIGRKLKNPITNETVEIVESKRKFDPEKIEPFLSIFSPSNKKYDYEYAIRNNIPTKNLLDWDGNMIERYPGLKPTEAIEKEISYLKEKNLIEKIDTENTDSVFLCKRNHKVDSIITLTWFLKLDDDKKPLRKNALERIRREGLVVFPTWREKGLIEWLEKMTDWPIARQNVWGIKIPVWYDISDPSKFLIWFVDNLGEKKYGNLKEFLDKGVSFEEISNGLERIYTTETNLWTIKKESGKNYLQETDTFDTWFCSGQWSTIVYENKNNAEDFSYFYPSHSIVIGQDLLRLSIAKKILLSEYLTNKLPFKTVYLNRLIKGKDGQKMSKSLGNDVSLEYYLEKFGADITRMGMISYTAEKEDFIFEEKRLEFYKKFADRLWKMGRVSEVANQYVNNLFDSSNFSNEDKNLLMKIEKLSSDTNTYIEKFSFAITQEKLCNFIFELEEYAEKIFTRKDKEVSLDVFRKVFKKYLQALHPFMPFVTEELNLKLFNSPLSIQTKN